MSGKLTYIWDPTIFPDPNAATPTNLADADTIIQYWRQCRLSYATPHKPYSMLGECLHMVVESGQYPTAFNHDHRDIRTIILKQQGQALLQLPINPHQSNQIHTLYRILCQELKLIIYDSHGHTVTLPDGRSYPEDFFDDHLH